VDAPICTPKHILPLEDRTLFYNSDEELKKAGGSLPWDGSCFFRPSLGTLGTTAPSASPEALKQCQEAFARKAEVLKSVWEAQGGVKDGEGRPMVEGELAAEAGIGEICVVRASVSGLSKQFRPSSRCLSESRTQIKGEPKISAPKSVGK